MNLIQFKTESGERRVAQVVSPETVRVLDGVESVIALAAEAIGAGISLDGAAARHAGEATADYAALAEEGRLLPPVDHPDPAHCLVTGTGLSHLGSAEGRDKMHADLEAGESGLSDSMKMFKMGLEGGKPEGDAIGVQPEWFYKGDGDWIATPGAPLVMPSFALDGGEEPEVAGIYYIGPDGTPYRLGFALGNEFSDHVTEKQNYLFLAHSKLRSSSLGPELRTGALPDDVRGTVRLRRDGAVIWEKEFLTGEANMSHSIANLEHHHFKYAPFRRPGDVHIHYFGTATLSFSDGIETKPGDQFEIESTPFGRPLVNSLARSDNAPAKVTVQGL